MELSILASIYMYITSQNILFRKSLNGNMVILKYVDGIIYDTTEKYVLFAYCRLEE